jgi:hypothetical protein
MHRKKTGIRFSAGAVLPIQRLCDERPARAGADDGARTNIGTLVSGGRSGIMSIGLPTSPRSSRGGDNDDAVLDVVWRELDNIAFDGPMRAHRASRGFAPRRRRKVSVRVTLYKRRAANPLRAGGPRTAQPGRDKQGLSVLHR